MTEQSDKPSGGSAVVDVLLAIAAVALVIGGLAAYYVLTAQPAWVRWTSLGAGIVLGVVVFALSAFGRMAWEFAQGARVELRKMVWPTGRDTRITTVIVVAFVAILGIFFWVVDWLLAHGTRALLGTGS